MSNQNNTKMVTDSFVIFVEPHRDLWESIAAQDKAEGKPQPEKNYGNVTLLSNSGNIIDFSPTSDPMRRHRHAIFISFEAKAGALKKVQKAVEDVPCEIYEIVCCRGMTVTGAATEIQNMVQSELDFPICCVPMQTVDEI